MQIRFCLSLFLVLVPFSGCNRSEAEEAPEVKRGAELIRKFGCGACHEIPGIEDAKGVVGPPLMTIGRRVFIAGLLRNTPENMAAWLENPQRIVPGNAMPDMGLTPQQARAIAAYLATLR
jgi:cytochrome c2